MAWIGVGRASVSAWHRAWKTSTLITAACLFRERRLISGNDVPDGEVIVREERVAERLKGKDKKKKKWIYSDGIPGLNVKTRIDM